MISPKKLSLIKLKKILSDKGFTIKKKKSNFLLKDLKNYTAPHLVLDKVLHFVFLERLLIVSTTSFIFTLAILQIINM